MYWQLWLGSGVCGPRKVSAGFALEWRAPHLLVCDELGKQALHEALHHEEASHLGQGQRSNTAAAAVAAVQQVERVLQV